MATNGLLIDYEYCIGCHACEVACKKEHGFEKGQFGIQVFQMGPREIAEDEWEFMYVPVRTKRCDLCADRVAEGRFPTCVHHCMTKAIKFGSIDDMAEELKKKPMQVLYSV